MSRRAKRPAFKSNATELPKKRRRARVSKVHPNSTAARVWGLTHWTYRDE